MVDTYLYFSSLPLTLAVPSYRVRHTEKQTCQIISYCFGDEVQKKSLFSSYLGTRTCGASVAQSGPSGGWRGVLNYETSHCKSHK